MKSRPRDRMQTNALISASGPVEPVYPDYSARLDREVQPGYIFTCPGDQAARDKAIPCGGDLDSTGVERRWLRVEVPCPR